MRSLNPSASSLSVPAQNKGKGRSLKPVDLQPLRSAFGERLQEHVDLSRFTAARLGGPADWLLEVRSADELARAVRQLWEADLPFLILGGGSNVLVSDAGVREVVLLNRAREILFIEDEDPPIVRAESGANFGLVARQAGQRGLTGLEWAAGIPGTVGGAVFGNAGAHGSDVAGSLVVAEILHRSGIDRWPVEKLSYEYRSSVLKRRPQQAVILAATLRLERGAPGAIQAKLDEYLAHRRRTQPPGASMGSMFKNPLGNYAGRLIEAAGLKGTRVNDAEISPLHANFFINHGQATSTDVYALIRMARQAVLEKFGVELELEVELVGEW